MAVLRNIKADELEALRAEVAALKAKPIKSVSFKIGDKGGLSVYMGSRFPTTLYYEQWQTLLDHKEVILAYLEDNKSRMKLRD
jgi:hypothetical protein